MKIEKVYAREVLDSRGLPTIEVDVHAGGDFGREMVPSGASTGSHEALELRDGGDRFHGMGVREAVQNVNDVIAPELEGMDVTDQEAVDTRLCEIDGTERKERLGGNAILGVSLATARAAALVQDKNFYEYFADLVNNEEYIIPTPFMNIINGGTHADNKLEFQEYHVVPGGDSFQESLRMASEIYYELKEVIHKRLGPFQVNVGDEGGFTPNLERYYEPLDLIWDAVERLGYDGSVKLGIDAAATEFYEHGKYEFDQERRDTVDMLHIYEELVQDYPICSLEDPFHEDDFEAFATLLDDVPETVNVVGDDLLCTNTDRIATAAEHGSCDDLLLKVNQIGTITEAIDAARTAIGNDWDVMVSHRSGETADHFIADFAVGLSTGQIKAGAPCRGERTAKYNQLLRLEEALGDECRYTGTTCFHSCPVHAGK